MDTEGFAKVLAEHKELTINGFETSLMRRKQEKYTGVKSLPKQPPTSEGTQLCVDWLLKHDALDRRQTVNFDRSSYSWKHVVERDVKQYISNGEFICAALYLGYKMKRPDRHSPNAFFNIRNVKRS